MNPSVGSTRSCGGSGQVGRGMAGTGFSQLLPCFTSPHSALPRKRGRECESPVRRREARASVSAWWYEISANSLKFLQVLHSDVTLVVFPHRSGGWLWILRSGDVPGNARKKVLNKPDGRPYRKLPKSQTLTQRTTPTPHPAHVQRTRHSLISAAHSPSGAAYQRESTWSRPHVPVTSRPRFQHQSIHNHPQRRGIHAGPLRGPATAMKTQQPPCK